jgi:hypothetical protein
MYITHLGQLDPQKVKRVSRPTIYYNTDGGRSEWLPIQVTYDTHIVKDELNNLMLKLLGDVFVDIVEVEDGKPEIKESWILRDARIDAVNLSPPEEMTEVIVTLTYSSAMLLM